MDEDHPLRDVQHYGRVKGLAVGPVEMKTLSEVPDIDADITESDAMVKSLCSSLQRVATVSPHASLLPKPSFPVASK
jgi:hypothetical protein